MESGRNDEPPPRFLLTCDGTTGKPCDACALYSERKQTIDPMAMLLGKMTPTEPTARGDRWGRAIGCKVLLSMSAHNYGRSGGDGGCNKCGCLPSHPIHGASMRWAGIRWRHGIR